MSLLLCVGVEQHQASSSTTWYLSTHLHSSSNVLLFLLSFSWAQASAATIEANQSVGPPIKKKRGWKLIACDGWHTSVHNAIDTNAPLDRSSSAASSRRLWKKKERKALARLRHLLSSPVQPPTTIPVQMQFPFHRRDPIRSYDEQKMRRTPSIPIFISVPHHQTVGELLKSSLNRTRRRRHLDSYFLLFFRPQFRIRFLVLQCSAAAFDWWWRNLCCTSARRNSHQLKM